MLTFKPEITYCIFCHGYWILIFSIFRIHQYIGSIKKDAYCTAIREKNNTVLIWVSNLSAMETIHEKSGRISLPIYGMGEIMIDRRKPDQDLHVHVHVPQNLLLWSVVLPTELSVTYIWIDLTISFSNAIIPQRSPRLFP